MISTLTRHTLLATAIAAALSTAAHAQVRQVIMGTNLDANPNVNSGGSNAPVAGYVPVNGNDVMTGNVSGLGYFHGRNPIGNSSSFQAPLGTSTLNNFTRQSAPLTKSGAPTSYYLPSSTVAGGQGSLYSTPTGSGFDSRIIPVTAFNPRASSSQIAALNGTVQGQGYNRQPAPAAPLDASVQGGALNNPLFLTRNTAELERLRLEQAKQPATRPDDATTTQPSLQLNEQVSASRNPNLNGRNPEQRGGTALNENVDGSVGEVFAKLAEELKQAAGIPNTAPDQTPVGLTLTSPIDPLTGRPRPLAPSVAANTTATVGTGTTTRPGQDNANKTTAGVSAKPLENLSTAQLAAGSKVKPLKMAPAPSGSVTPTEFALLMGRGEQSLRDGKFLDAQIAYQTALSKKPEDALALVGLAHAELAAGAYVPAAYDMKFVFTRKPEMIAVRYDPSSFIPADRQVQVLADLQRKMENKETAEMASFLYCYLCYQTGRTTQLDAQLQKWGGQEGHDSWQPVLSRAWHDLTLKEPAK